MMSFLIAVTIGTVGTLIFLALKEIVDELSGIRAALERQSPPLKAEVPPDPQSAKGGE